MNQRATGVKKSIAEPPAAVVVAVDVIADEIARAISDTPPIPRAPARARAESQSTQGTPARATPSTASSTTTPARAKPAPNPMRETPARDVTLTAIRNLGRILDDLERTRIMGANRIRAARDDGIDSPWMDRVEAGLRAVEHEAELQLKRVWRKHPLAPWAKAIPGAGEILMARLIAEIGGPPGDKSDYDRAPLDAPNPGKLLAYCGHGDPIRAGQIPKGATQAELFKRGSPHAKKAVWKLAYQFMRTVGTPAEAIDSAESIPAPLPQSASDDAIDDTEAIRNPRRRAPRSPYRDIYDARKAQTEGRLHERACVRCGPAGRPALPGSPWSDAHRHADALRIVGKRFLIDLWAANRDLASAQERNATQVVYGGGES